MRSPLALALLLSSVAPSALADDGKGTAKAPASSRSGSPALPVPATPPAAPRLSPPAAVADRWRGADRPYLEAVHARLHDRWTGFLRELVRAPAAFQNPELAVTLELAVAADGTLAEVKTSGGSGLQGFDDAPRDLLADLGALPAPPPGLRSDDDRAHLRWRFARKEPGCEEYALFEFRLPLDEALAKLAQAGRDPEATARLDETRRSDPAAARAALPRLALAMGTAAAAAGDPSIRAAAATVLGRAPGGEPILVRLAGDADASVRLAALQALGVPPRTPAARDLLVQTLQGNDAAARAVAARALGSLGDKAAVAPLATALERGTAPMESAWALGQLGEGARAAATVSALLSAKGPQRLAGAQGAAGLADPALGAKLSAAIAGASEEARAALADALAATGSSTSPDGKKALIKLLHDSSPRVRARACAATAAIGDKPARARLVEALADPQPAVRAAAVTALCDLGGAASADELLHAASDKAAPVRQALATGLAAHPFDGSDRILARLSDDKEPAVKAAATPGPRGAGEPEDALGRLVHARDRAARLSALADALAGK